MNKKTKIIIIITLLSILIIGLISMMVFVISKGGFNFISLGISSKVSTNLVYDEVYETNFSKININSDISDIEIKQSNDEKIEVLIYSNEKDNNVNVNDSENLNVSLKEKGGFNLFKWNRLNSRIEIYIPINYDKNIEIISSYGDIRIDRFTNSNISIESDCGDIDIDEVDTVKVKNSYGDTFINKANKVDIASDCGDVEVGSVGYISLDNSYGDIEIRNINNYMNIIADCGDIEIDNVLLTKNSKIKSDFGDVSIENIKDVYIDAKVDLGDVSIKNNYRRSDITLNIESDLGDIEVNE